MKKALLFIAFTTFSSVYAQKLPNVQKASVWAPPSIKIDGKAPEWQDKYEAYNNATDINYTLSNDDKNLYLVIKATHKLVIGGKILAGGISFTVNHTLSKKDATAITVTYPLAQGTDRGVLSELFYGAAGMMSSNSGGGNSLDRLNKTFTEKSKYIGIAGIKSVTENEIPIYNNLDIKVAAAFHAPAIYVYELAIPLALLALPEFGSQEFSYHIKLNVSPRAGAPIAPAYSNRPPEPALDPTSSTPTDFWGVYTLAKKP